MVKPNLLYELRRFRHLSSFSSPIVLARSIHSQSPSSLLSPSNVCNNYSNFRHRSQSRWSATEDSLAFSNFVLFRFLSIPTSSSGPKNMDFNLKVESTTESEVLNLGFKAGSEVAEGSISSDEWYHPVVGTVISLMDGYHDLSGLPWWLTIASSTLALRVALLPVLILQLKKLKRISELFPKLPPPFPPPLSRKSYLQQYLLFQKEKRAIGCPSFLWCLAFVSVQVPCFLLWMTTIRRMSLDHHPGFDCGGTLWFQDLTDSPHGVLGMVFPILIAGLHYINVQISFRTTSVGKLTGLFSLLAKYYKLYLDILTLPMFLVGFCIPQGSLVYWLTNSSLTVIQQLSLNHDFVREKLGLPDKNDLGKNGMSTDSGTPEIQYLDAQMGHKISVQKLSPDELLSLSIQLLAEGHNDRAVPLLRMTLEKNPDYVRALVVLGQTLMQKGILSEATEYFERAISKLIIDGYPTEDEEIDLLILASSWAGVTFIKQGRTPEGLEHLQRVSQLKEPEDPKSKTHYFDGLVLLASVLCNEGRKDEAVKHLRMAAAYDPAYNEYLQQCIEDTDILANDRRN